MKRNGLILAFALALWLVCGCARKASSRSRVSASTAAVEKVGVEIDGTQFGGRTQGGTNDVAKLLWQAYQNRKRVPLVDAAITGDVKKMKSLLGAGQSTEQSESDGYTPLIIVSTGDPRIRIWKFSGQKVDESMFRSETNMRYMQCVRLLVAHGADVNRETGDGTTPLSEAIIVGQIEIESILRLAGATNEGKGGIVPGPVRR